MTGNLVPEHLQEWLQNSPAQPFQGSLRASHGMAGFHQVEKVRNNSPEASELLYTRARADPLAQTPAHAV